MPVQDHRTTNQEIFSPKNLPATTANKKPEINFNEYSHIAVKNSRVMVKPIKVNYEESSSGIILNTAEKRPEFSQGVVVAVGEGFLDAKGNRIPVPHEVGDIVFFGDMAGIDFKLIRGGGKFEKVKVVDSQSIYYVDCSCTDLYVNVTP